MDFWQFYVSLYIIFILELERMSVVKVDPVFHPQKIINETLFFNYQRKVLNSTLTIAKASSKFFEINYDELCDKLKFFQKNKAPSIFFHITHIWYIF